MHLMKRTPKEENRMKNVKRICHFTIKHRTDDNRIFELETLHVAKNGYKVFLLGICDSEKIEHGVHIIPVRTGMFGVLKQCMSLECDIYQFHDPQLLGVGILLRILGKKVIFDAHENYEEKLKSRIEVKFPRLKPVKNILAKIGWFGEKICVSLLSGKVAADSTVLNKYGKNTILLPNVPGKEFFADLMPRTRKDNTFRLIYVGTLTWDRGIVQTIEAIQKTRHSNVEFHIIGDTKDDKLVDLIKNAPKTIWHGRVPWRELKYHLVEADVGVVLLQPIDAYLYYPGENIVKLWEYMSMKLPVLISDFPKLRKLCKQLQFGLCVKPDDPEKIAEAIDWMIEHPEECKHFGKCGRKVVEEEYHAEKQIEKLFALYRMLLE
jgi:glycosyltransferase involved in cell wall biosynthesis